MSTALDLGAELRRSNPDIVVDSPRSTSHEAVDTGHEHFLVFETPRGRHAAVWTQSSWEGAGNHRIVIAHSPDGRRMPWFPDREFFLLGKELTDGVLGI